MKKKTLFYPLLMTLCFSLLAGCSFSFDLNAFMSSGSFMSQSSISSEESFSSSGSSFSSSFNSSNGNDEKETKSISLYAMNDFHGSVNETGQELGLLKQGTFFKQKGKEENTLILNSGDMWQGSIESNSNYGELLTKAMNEIEFDCFTLGNHEFDWGDKFIKNNRALIDEDTQYQTPFLAANIYNYDISLGISSTQANELGDRYVIKELENGLKVGIIGVIGEDQISSITSQYVDNYAFLDTTPIIKELSDELRIEQGCDVVVVDAHASVEQIIGSTSNDNVGITSISSVSKQRYVDAVFCAHSHQYEEYLINGVPFVQGASNGKSYSEIILEVNENGEVSCSKYDDHYLSAKEIANIIDYDIELENLINEYKTESDKLGNEVLGTIEGYFESNNTYSVANIAVAAFASFAGNNNIEIDYAITNGARDGLDAGELTYAELYKALPFDNVVYLVEVSGSTISRQAGFNYVYRVNEEALVSSNTYTVAVIDYLALHRNDNRVYDYFRDANIVGKFEKTGYQIYNYRDITADYIRNLTAQGKTLKSSEHNTNLPRFDADSLASSL